MPNRGCGIAAYTPFEDIRLSLAELVRVQWAVPEPERNLRESTWNILEAGKVVRNLRGDGWIHEHKNEADICKNSQFNLHQ